MTPTAKSGVISCRAAPAPLRQILVPHDVPLADGKAYQCPSQSGRILQHWRTPDGTLANFRPDLPLLCQSCPAFQFT